jgi:hypothetical protein
MPFARWSVPIGFRERPSNITKNTETTQLDVPQSLPGALWAGYPAGLSPAQTGGVTRDVIIPKGFR